LVAAAEEMIKRAKERDDTDTAVWAALKGVMACPWHKPIQQTFDRLQHQTNTPINTDEFINKNWQIWNQTEDTW
jgi:hypothetical protein